MLFLVTKEAFGFQTIFDALEDGRNGVGRTRDIIINDPAIPEIPARLVLVWSETRPLQPEPLAVFLRRPDDPRPGIFNSVIVDENISSVAEFMEFGWAVYSIEEGGGLTLLSSDGEPVTPPDDDDGTPGFTGDDQDDRFVSTAQDDVIDGRGGRDTVAFSGNKDDYVLTLGQSSAVLRDRRADGDGADELTSIEVLSFLDQDWPIGIFDGVAGLSEQAIREFIEVYIAYFNRAPDAEGLFFYGTAFANGTSLEQSAATFLNSSEYQATYPSGLSNQEFAEAVYDNVLGRIPDLLGLEFWVGVLDAGDVSRDVFILEVLKGAKAPAPNDASQDFIDQKAADLAYLENKTDVGLYYSVVKGMSDVTNATTAMQLFDDGDPADITAAVAAIDRFYDDALDPANGQFLLQLVGVVDDPFAV